MNKIRNFIEKIARNNILKGILVFLFVGLLFVGKVYAVDDMSSIATVSWILNLVLSLASWVWIILANLAGKLMTNDFVYGSFLHLDASLWTLWNIIKNFANFALGFLVLFSIVRSLFDINGKFDDKWSPKNIIIKTLIAGVLIQMSWFLMAVIVDLSTIVTSAIGSFPAQLIVSDNGFRGNMTNQIRSLTKGNIIFNPEDKENLVERVPSTGGSLGDLDDDEMKELLDILMPSNDSVSGPLLFLGLSVFNFNDFQNVSSEGFSTSNVDNWGDMFLSLSLSAIVLIFFSLMMFFIFIFNLFRLIMLWIIIPLLPLIVLIKVFGLADKLKGGSGGMDISKFVDIKTILILIFKPVLMVGALSMILIVLVLIDNVISPDKDGTVLLTNDVGIESNAVGDDGLYTSTIKSEGIVEFTISNTKDTIADIIVYFFGLFLIYFLVKIVVKKDTGIGFIDKTMSGLFDTFENVVTNLPIIPIAGGVGFKSVVQGVETEKSLSRYLGIDETSQTRDIGKFFGLPDNVSEEEFIANAVKQYASQYDNFKSFRSAVQMDIDNWQKNNNKPMSIVELKKAYDAYRK